VTGVLQPLEVARPQLCFTLLHPHSGKSTEAVQQGARGG
jgi:hypothetical protein